MRKSRPAQESGYSNTDLRGVGVGRAFYDARFQGGPKGVASTTTSAARARSRALTRRGWTRA
jgi:hypothetical protein